MWKAIHNNTNAYLKFTVSNPCGVREYMAICSPIRGSFDLSWEHEIQRGVFIKDLW